MFFTVPTILTWTRIVAIPLIMGVFYLRWPPEPVQNMVATVMFIVFAFTDWLDGYLARRLKQTSAFGAFLDPVADKLLVAVCLVFLLRDAILLRDYSGGILALLVAIIIGREITVSALREWMAELGSRANVAVSKIGKWKTAFQMTAIGMMIWRDVTFGLPIYEIGYALLLVAAVLTIWSMVVYLRNAWPYMKE